MIMTIPMWILCISLTLLLYYTYLDEKKESLEDSIFKAMNTIASSSRLGEAPETAIKRISEMKKEPASKIFKELIERTEKGENIAEAITVISKKKDSDVLTYLGPVLSSAQIAGTDVYDVMNSYSTKLWQLKYQEKYAKDTAKGNLLVLRIMAVAVLPGVFFFFPMILEEAQFDPFIFNFFAAFAALLGLLDYIIYDDWKKSLLLTPFFGSLTYLAPAFFAKLPEYLELLKGLIL